MARAVVQTSPRHGTRSSRLAVAAGVSVQRQSFRRGHDLYPPGPGREPRRYQEVHLAVLSLDREELRYRQSEELAQQHPIYP